MLAPVWRDQILRASRVIEDMARLNHAAERCLGIIRGLCGVHLETFPDAEGTNEGDGESGGTWSAKGPTQESPQTQLSSLYPLLWPTLETADGVGDAAMLCVFIIEVDVC